MKTKIRSICIPAIVLLFASAPAMAAEQCFDRAGTYGNLEVTESGAGCGTYIGSQLWLGNSNTDESCTFSFNPAIDGSSITLELDAHNTNYPSHAEEAIISMNGSQVVVEASDFISGGLKQSTGGVESPTLGGITEGTSANGLVGFTNAPVAVSSMEIQQNWIIGGPNGTLYVVCADDEGAGPSAPPKAVPALTTWGLLILLLLVGFAAFTRRRQLQ